MRGERREDRRRGWGFDDILIGIDKGDLPDCVSVTLDNNA